MKRLTELDWVTKETISLLDTLTYHFCELLNNKFSHYFRSTNYWYKIKYLISKTEDEKRNNHKWNSITDLDLYALLKLAERSIHELNSFVISNTNPELILKEMKNVRTVLIGHKPVSGVKANELEQHLLTTEQFSSLINSPAELHQRILDLKNKVIQIKSGVVFGDELTPGKGIVPVQEIKVPSITLKDVFADNSLTLSQIDAVNSLENFLINENNNCFLLKGFAGTGKTFLIGKIIEYLNNINREYITMAPTGRAARIISEAHKIKCSTIHRSIYYFNKIKQYEEKDEEGKTTYKYYYELRYNDSNHGTVFIVDEASLISDCYSEQEFIKFGSGRLLYDLLRYINFEVRDSKKKIIFVGDDAQLPPVNMSTSPALEEEYLKINYKLRTTSAILTDVKRQSTDSNILKVATKIRTNISLKKINSFQLYSDDKDVFNLTTNDFIKNYLNTYDSQQMNNIIITHTNNAAYDYNKIIRSSLFADKEMITKNDRIIVVKNNYTSTLEVMNGQMGVVEDIDPVPERRSIPINMGKERSESKYIQFINLTFRKMNIRFRDVESTDHILPFIIIENILYNSQPTLSSEESKALYVDFRKRNPDLKPGTELFKQIISSDPYFNALQIKFGYAITCHKAQGGGWQNVFIDFLGKNNINMDSLRWSYTAVTRAEKKLFVTNILNVSLLKPIHMNISDVNKIPGEIVLKEIDTTEFFKENTNNVENDFRKIILSNVNQILTDEFKLVNELHRDYLEQYIFRCNEKDYTIKINYNKKNVITSLQGDNVLKEKLNCLIGKKFESKKPIGQIPKLTLEDKNSETLNEIINAYFKYGMVSEVKKHSDYHYHLSIYNDNDCIEVNIYFDDFSRITKIEPAEKYFNELLFKKILLIHIK